MGRSLRQPRLEFFFPGGTQWKKFTGRLIQIRVFLELSQCSAAPGLKHVAGIKFRTHIYLLGWTHLIMSSPACFKSSAWKQFIALWFPTTLGVSVRMWVRIGQSKPFLAAQSAADTQPNAGILQPLWTLGRTKISQQTPQFSKGEEPEIPERVTDV